MPLDNGLHLPAYDGATVQIYIKLFSERDFYGSDIIQINVENICPAYDGGEN